MENQPAPAERGPPIKIPQKGILGMYNYSSRPGQGHALNKLRASAVFLNKFIIHQQEINI